MTVRVVVVDDNALLRAGLTTVLASDPGLEVVGEAPDGPAAVRLVVREQPDVALMDVEMPGGDGLTAVAELRVRCPRTRVLVLTMFDLDEYVADALRAGAAGFLLKTTAPGELVAAVKACAAGQVAVGPTVVTRLVDSFVAREPRPHPGLADLTDRELDVLRAMARGLSNAEIGVELYVAETTVKTHVARVLAKLGVRDRVQAVVLAHRAGVTR